jgi:hypothetical protein
MMAMERKDRLTGICGFLAVVFGRAGPQLLDTTRLLRAP